MGWIVFEGVMICSGSGLGDLLYIMYSYDRHTHLRGLLMRITNVSYMQNELVVMMIMMMWSAQPLGALVTAN